MAIRDGAGEVREMAQGFRALAEDQVQLLVPMPGDSQLPGAPAMGELEASDLSGHLHSFKSHSPIYIAKNNLKDFWKKKWL